MYQEQLPAHLLPESGNASQTGTLQEIYFRQAVEYLEHNFSYPVKIEQLARQVGVSRTYLYKIFISHSGKSVQQYLLDLRLEAAMDMLKKTRRDITEIAYSCGFTDSPSFCRQFKKTTGRTPVSYTHLDVYKRQVQTHLVAAEGMYGSGGEIADILVSSLDIVGNFTDIFIAGAGDFHLAVQIILHLFQYGILHFKAVFVYNFNSVVIKRVMAGGNHDAKVKIPALCPVSYTHLFEYLIKIVIVLDAALHCNFLQ